MLLVEAAKVSLIRFWICVKGSDGSMNTTAWRGQDGVMTMRGKALRVEVDIVSDTGTGGMSRRVDDVATLDGWQERKFADAGEV